MERLFGGPVFLEVWVRVKRGWADDDALADALRLLRPRDWLDSMAARAQPLRRDDQPAFVLHTYPYRETSLIVEAFTRGVRPRRDGRARREAPALGAARAAAGVPAAARCRGPGSSELKTLLKAEWRGGLPLLGGSALALRLLPERAAAEAAAARGSASAPVRELRGGARRRSPRAATQAPVLRRFELALLAELGYALPLAREPTPARRSIRPRATITRSTAGRGARRPEPRRALAGGARRDAAGAGRRPLSRCRDRGRGEAADARRARSLPRAARRREPPRRAGPAGARRAPRRGERPP